MNSPAHISFLVVFLLLLPPPSSSSDATALLALKLAVDPQNAALQRWRTGAAFFCRWPGVRACLKNRVSRLLLENLNLTGKLDGKSLNRLDQLRVLSFKHNRLSGEIPDLSGLAGLKTLYLNGNAFTGRFPAWVSALRRLKTIVLSDNLLSGEIPPAVAALPRLYTLCVDSNGFTGPIPPLNQTTLRFLNFSGNRFSGRIPETVALAQFSSSAFSGNGDLCGEVIHTPCLPPATTINLPPSTTGGKHNRHYNTTVIIVVSSVLLIVLVAVLLTAGVAHRRGRKVAVEGEREKKAEAAGGASERVEAPAKSPWEGAEELVFVGPAAAAEEGWYTVEELLKATAETLGRGTVGTTYKAVMESGYTVTVKRLRDGRYPPASEFRQRAVALGRMRHPNLVPVRAYFQTNEEKLLVYDYFPNGNVFSLVHGSRASGRGKPLHWTSCLKIAEDVSSGLLYIHQTSKMAHGNLKSTNILLGHEFESCLTDYCLQSFRSPNIFNNEPTTPSFFYKAPELRCSTEKSAQASPSPSPQSDVYSFGVVLLELLTGKSPHQDMVADHESDVLKSVRSIEDSSSGTETLEEKLVDLMNIAMACVATKPEERPTMKEVLRMVQDVRGKVVMSSSSNGNDHSLEGWWDNVQDMQREEHQIM